MSADMKAAIANGERLYRQLATKAQLIRMLLDTDTDNSRELADFLEFLCFAYIRGPWGEVPDNMPENAELGLRWTMWLLYGGEDRDTYCPEFVLAMQKATPTDKATGWLIEA